MIRFFAITTAAAIIAEAYLRAQIGFLSLGWLGTKGSALFYAQTLDKALAAGILFLGVLIASRPIEKSVKYGAARWATLKDIRKMHKKIPLLSRSGIVLGKIKNQLLMTDGSLSVLLFAPPGTGKTTSFVIPTIFSIGDKSMIVNDPKGELYDITSAQRSWLGGVFKFDPVSETSCQFNPLCKAFIPEAQEQWRPYIERVANAVVKRSREGENDYWTSAARSVFVFIAEWLIWKHGETSIPAVRDQLLMDERPANTFREMLAEDGLPDFILKDGNAVLLPADSDNQWAGVMSTLSESLNLYSDPAIKKAVGGGADFSAASLRSEVQSVYLIVRKQDEERLAPLIRLVFEIIGSGLISKKPDKKELPVTLILDEFPTLGRLEVIRSMPATSRGYGVNILLICQSFEQICTTYGEKAASTFDDNCAYRIILSLNSTATARKYSELVGDATDIRKSQSKKTAELLHSHESQSEEALRLIKVNDITSLPVGEGYLLAQHYNRNPMKIVAPYYLHDPKFKKMAARKAKRHV